MMKGHNSLLATLLLCAGLATFAACESNDSGNNGLATCHSWDYFLLWCDPGCGATSDCEARYDAILDGYVLDELDACADCLDAEARAQTCGECLDGSGDPCEWILEDNLYADCSY